MPSVFKYLALFAMGESRLSVQALTRPPPTHPFFIKSTSQLPALFLQFLRATVAVPTGVRTITLAAASRTTENVYRLRPTITFSVSAAPRASSGTSQRRLATIQPIGKRGKEIKILSDIAPSGIGV